MVAAATVHAAQKSTTQIVENQAEAYFALKKLVEDEWKGWDQTTDGEDGSTYATLGYCADGSEIFVVPGKARKRMVDLAFFVISARKILQRNNFPPEVWRPLLVQFEAERIDLFDSKDLDDETFSRMNSRYLSQLINQNVKEAGLKLPRLGETECGGGPLQLKISFEPDGGAVLAIPKLFYRYCQKMGIDPLDRDRCDHWLPPIHNGETVALGGIYFYKIVAGGKESELKVADPDRAEAVDEYTFE